MEATNRARDELFEDECLKEIVSVEGFSHKNDNDAQRVITALKDKYGEGREQKMPRFELAGGEWVVNFRRGRGLMVKRAHIKVDQMSRAQHEAKKADDRDRSKKNRDKRERETGKRSRPGSPPASFDIALHPESHS